MVQDTTYYTIKMRPLINPIRLRAEQEVPIVESRVNGGMITAIDPADIENNQFQDVKNFIIRDDKTIRRNGFSIFSPAKPDSEKVLLLTTFKRFNSDVKTIRFTPTTVNILGAGVWTNVTGTLTGTDNDRFSTAIINDRFFFANGVDEVQELNVAGLSFADAGNWDEYKYLTGSFNRLIGANLNTAGLENPVKIGWSGDLNFLETNPAVDFSAGFEFLAESPSDYADFITGLVGVPAMLLIPKERSIWGGIKQPSASNPFLFQTIVPGIGCDCPHSVQKIPNGIAWVDFRTASIYTYLIGQQLPTPIGRGSIERTLISQITDPDLVFSDYNAATNKYRICIPSELTSTVKVWCFDFRTNTWTYDEMENISTMNSIDYATGGLMFDELVGSFDSLVGAYNDLSNPIISIARFVGEVDGDLLTESNGVDTDNGVAFTSILHSKIFELPSIDTYFASIRIEYVCTKNGSFDIQYRKDNDDWVTAKTVTANLSTVRKLVTYKKNMKARQFEWRIICTSGLFEFIEYEILAIPGAKSK
jgi:hypothetical protein